METKIVLSRLYKFRKKSKIKKAQKVIRLMSDVINSSEFKSAVLAFQFQDRRYKLDPKEEYRSIEDNQEIYDILKKGWEQGSLDGADYTWKLYIELGRGLSQVGRREGNRIITQNWFFKKKNNEIDIAAHWIHEYLHVLGFGHDYENTARRPFSVPYGIGGIVESLLKN